MHGYFTAQDGGTSRDTKPAVRQGLCIPILFGGYLRADWCISSWFYVGQHRRERTSHQNIVCSCLQSTYVISFPKATHPVLYYKSGPFGMGDLTTWKVTRGSAKCVSQSRLPDGTHSQKKKEAKYPYETCHCINIGRECSTLHLSRCLICHLMFSNTDAIKSALGFAPMRIYTIPLSSALGSTTTDTTISATSWLREIRLSGRKTSGLH